MANFQQYNTTTVENAFRPLLNEIDFANLDLLNVPLVSYDKLEQYLPLLKGKKCRLVLVAKDIDDVLGYNMLSLLDNTYSVIICLSKKLFKGGIHDDPMIRNIVGIHEFLHAISALFVIPQLNDKEKNNAFLKEYQTKMMLDILSIDTIKEHHESILGTRDVLFFRDDDCFYPNTIFFKDDHFRLSLDKTPQKYHNLNERFLLPRDKFEAYFNKGELRALKLLITKGKLKEAFTAAQSKIAVITNDMHLEFDFVIRRMAEILISYAL
ncbi:MAG: hypothetical protein LBB81_00825 [Treponema sp.]|jgi:hypothetical protein|nr:hypothetical protein [Treponema sp.]